MLALREGWVAEKRPVVNLPVASDPARKLVVAAVATGLLVGAALVVRLANPIGLAGPVRLGDGAAAVGRRAR